MSSSNLEGDLPELEKALGVLLDPNRSLQELIPTLTKWLHHVSGRARGGKATSATEAYLAAIGELVLPRLMEALKAANSCQSDAFKLSSELLRGMHARGSAENTGELDKLLALMADIVGSSFIVRGDELTQLEEAHFSFDKMIRASQFKVPSHHTVSEKRGKPDLVDLRSRRRATFCESTVDKHTWIQFRIAPELTGK